MPYVGEWKHASVCVWALRARVQEEAHVWARRGCLVTDKRW